MSLTRPFLPPTSRPTSMVVDEDINTLFSDRPWEGSPAIPSIVPTISAPPSTAPVPTVEQSSSDPASRKPAGPAPQAGDLKIGRPCRLQPLEGTFSVITLAVTVAGLCLCLTFLGRAWRHWQKCRTLIEVEVDVDPNNSPVVGPKASLASPVLGADRPPSSPIRRGSAASKSESLKRPSEATLLLAAWVLFTLDHLSLLGMIAALFFLCPQYNCWHKPPAHTPGCPVPELFASWHVLLTLGASVFVLATLQRFLRVFALLSHKRYIVLCICTLVVFLVSLSRLGAIAFHTFVRLSSYSVWSVSSPMRKLAGRINRVSYLVYFFSLAVLALVSLLLGLQFVLNVRASLIRVHRHTMSPVCTPVSTPVLSALGIHGHGPDQDAADDSLYQQAQGHLRRRRRSVIGWILVSLMLLSNFAVIALIPKDEIPMPVNLFNSLLLCFVKALVAAVSMAMSEVVKLATAEDQVKKNCAGQRS